MHENTDSPDYTGILDGSPVADSYTSPEADKKLVSKLKKLFDEAQDYRRSYDRSWDLYRRYLKGETITIHKVTGDIVRLSAEDSKRLRSQKNSLRPTARSLVGKMTRTIPAVRVTPPSNDFEDMHAAQVGDALLQYVRRKERLDLKYQEACEYLPWAGNGFLELCWDPQAGERKSWCEVCGHTDELDLVGAACPTCQQQRQMELMQQQMEFEAIQADAASQLALAGPDPLTGETAPMPELTPPPLQQMGPLPIGEEPPPMVEIKTGDLKVEVHDPRDVYLEPGAECIADSRYIITRELLPVSTIRTMFPNFARFIKRESIHDQDTEDAADIVDSVDPYYVDENYSNHAYLFKFQEAPTEAYREGRIIWMVNDTIVKEIANPYYEDLGRFPIFHFGWDKNCGEIFYEPFIAQAWHRQKELNNNETAIREHTELLLKPKVLVPLGSRIATDEFSATSAQVISYNRMAGEPLNWMPPNVPTDLWQRGPQLEADIRQSAGITDSDVGLSQSDPNGRAMAIIQAEADQQLGPTMRRNNSEWRDLHRCILIVARKYYAPDRMWTVAGPDGTEVYHFYEMNLSGPIDCELEEMDGMSSNPAIRLQQAVDLAGLGYYIDPQTGLLDKKAFARAARLHDPSKGYEMEATERAAAAAIPAKLARGEPIQPRTFDDPMIFAEVLLGWLRGPGRRKDPMVSQQVEQVWQFYLEWAMTGMMPGQGFPMAQPGAGPAGGAPGGPMIAGSGAGGPDQSAPGGSANNPGHLGTDMSGGGAPIAAQANQQVRQADRAAEGAARVQSGREG